MDAGIFEEGTNLKLVPNSIFPSVDAPVRITYVDAEAKANFEPVF